MKKPAWNKIKVDYLQGVTPKDLAEKYSVEIEKLYKKIENDKWAAELRKIQGNIGNKVEERITKLTDKALSALEEVIENEESKPMDKVSAARAILDISGLKSSKQEITGNAFSVLINNKAVDIERDKI